MVHSEMTRTGWLETEDPLLNQLFSNILWGQKGNFLEVPTDCPQRDERYGWTGDGQLFLLIHPSSTNAFSCLRATYPMIAAPGISSFSASASLSSTAISRPPLVWGS